MCCSIWIWIPIYTEVIWDFQWNMTSILHCSQTKLFYAFRNLESHFLWFLSLKVTIIYASFTLLWGFIFEDHSLPTWNDLATLLSLTPPWHGYIKEMGCDVFCGSSRLLCVLLQHQMAKLLQLNDPQRFIRGTEIWRKILWFLEWWTLWQCFFRQCAVLKQMDSLCALFADLNRCLREFVEKKNHSDWSEKIDWACLAED